jgi:hypothetical protein
LTGKIACHILRGISLVLSVLLADYGGDLTNYSIAKKVVGLWTAYSPAAGWSAWSFMENQNLLTTSKAADFL